MSAPGGLPVTARQLGVAFLAVLVRPGLWVVALLQARRLATPHWWRTSPWLPVPPAEYVRFRLVTAYGADGPRDARELGRDLVAYLRWCRDPTG